MSNHQVNKNGITVEDMNIIESASSSPDNIKEFFSAWLSDGHAKKYSPEVYMSCIDKVSAYLISRKISIEDLWQLTNYDLFKSIYDKAVNDKLFRATDKKTHATFVQVGLAFLKFLKGKPTIHKVPDIPSKPSIQPDSHLTIKESIIRVLENEQQGMTVKQIYNKIIVDGLYSFGAQNPLNVMRVELERACVNSNITTRAAMECFRCERDQKGEKVYFFLSPIPTNIACQTKSNVNGEPNIQGEVKKEPLIIEIWNDSIDRNFQIWLESENYAPSTTRNYCGAVNRTMQNYKPLMEVAVSEYPTTSEAVSKFAALLHQNSSFIAANSAAHNQYSAAVSALCKFFDADNLPAQAVNEAHQSSNSAVPESFSNVAVYDWKSIPNINGTKPISICFSADCQAIHTSSWRALLICAYEYAVGTFPHADITKVSRGNGRRKLCSYNGHEVSYAEKLKCGLYVDVAFSANDVVRIIRGIFDLCGADVGGFEILYRNSGFGMPQLTEAVNTLVRNLSEEEKNIVAVFRKAFPYSMNFGFVDLSKLKSEYNSMFNIAISLTDEAVYHLICNNAIKTDPKAERYTHIDNLASRKVLIGIKLFIDNEIKNGIKRVYAKPIYDAFKGDLAITVDEDLLLTIIETTFCDEFKVNRKSMFVSSKGDVLTLTIGEEIGTAIIRMLQEDVMPFSVDDIANGLPGYPRNKVEGVLSNNINTIDSVVAVGDSQYAYIDYVYISDEQTEQIKDIVAQGVEVSGHKDIEELFAEIAETIPDVIDLNPEISKADIIKAIKNKIGDSYTVLHGCFLQKKGAR